MIPVSKPIPVQVIELHLPIVSLSWLEEKTTSKSAGTSYSKEERNYMKTFKLLARKSLKNLIKNFLRIETVLVKG